MRAEIYALTVAGLAALGGCAAEGDFGRRQPSVVTDEILPWAGTNLASIRGEAASDFMMTDDEKQLRDRAWRFLMPAHPRARFEGVLVELRRLRLMPARTPGTHTDAVHRQLRRIGLGLYDDQQPDVYFAALMSERWRSSRPPYRRLCNDIAADVALLDPLDAVADRVEATDRIRQQGLAQIPDLRAAERQNALDRIAENQGMIAWIGDAIEVRVGAYRYALQRLFIEIPERDAVACERLLAQLEARAGLSGPAAAAAPAVAGPHKGYYPWPEDERPIQK